MKNFFFGEHMRGPPRRREAARGRAPRLGRGFPTLEKPFRMMCEVKGYF